MKSVDKLRLLWGNSKIRIISLLILSILLVAIIAAGVILVYRQSKDNRDQQMAEKLDDLNNENVSCERTVSEIGSELVDNYSRPVQKKLLSLQLTCQSKLGNNEEAIRAGEKLKSMYDSEGDDYKARMTGLTIENVKTNKTLEESVKKYDTGQPVQ